MSDFKDIYSEGTIRIINGLEKQEYDSAEKLRDDLEKCDLYSFSQELWQLTAARFPCKIYGELLRECGSTAAGSKSFEKAAAVLPVTKRRTWSDYCSEYAAKKTDPAQLVFGFLEKTCLSHPICRPCTCKENLIKFFEATGTSGGTAKKNINNWLSGHSAPGSRKSCIQLCYALGLRIPGGSYIAPALNADRFLSMTCGQNPLYTRDAEEMIHYYCLMNPQGKKTGFDEDYDRAENYLYSMKLTEKAKTHKTAAAYNHYTFAAKELINRADGEDAILDLVASLSVTGEDRYASAKELLKRFYDEYDELCNPDPDGEKKKKSGKSQAADNAEKRRKLSKERAARIIDILSEAQTDSASLNELERFVNDGYVLSDALYSSSTVKDMIDGVRPVTRNVLMLTLLSLNYGVKYDMESGQMLDTEDFDEIAGGSFDRAVSFNSFCTRISETLDSCELAPLYPRRRFDYLVLYSYLRMSVDVSKRDTADALSDYLIRSMKNIGENDNIK